MAPQVHVISKGDVSKHTTVTVDATLPPLPEGSVRIRSKIISITVNNLAYAQLGTFLRWWDTYPVPQYLPSPYNDSEQWGIVPSWGYGQVVESKYPQIPEGALIYGYWPTSSLPIDCIFAPKEADGYFEEVSEHRKALMSLYNHYQVVDSDYPETHQAWDSTTLPTWLAGYFLDRYGFPSGAKPRIHPAGEGEWTVEDADLSSAVVVTLASSSKTARGLIWSLGKRTQGSGPLALLEATTSPQQLPSTDAKFPMAKTTYEDLSKQVTIDWIAKFKPSRVVLVNFGAASDIAQSFQDAILTMDTAPTNFTYITLTSMPSEDSGKDSRVTNVFMNTSPVIEQAFTAEGLDAVCVTRHAAFRQWVDEKAMGSMELQWGDGIGGTGGVDAAWDSLCTGNLPRQKALVFRI